MLDVSGDILLIEEGIICHQTNCLGMMGVGIALQIKNKWPHVYNDYVDFCKMISGATHADSLPLLGSIYVSKASPRIYVAHVFGQQKIGHGKLTSYDAVDLSLYKLKNKMRKSFGDHYQHVDVDFPIFFPKLMGCGYGGGKWKIYQSIIEEHFPRGTIVHYEKNRVPRRPWDGSPINKYSF